MKLIRKIRHAIWEMFVSYGATQAGIQIQDQARWDCYDEQL